MPSYINMPSDECFALISTMRLMENYATGNYTSETADLFRKTQQMMAERVCQLAMQAGQNAGVTPSQGSNQKGSDSTNSGQAVTASTALNNSLGVNLPPPSLPATPNTSAQPAAPATPAPAVTSAANSIPSKLGL